MGRRNDTRADRARWIWAVGAQINSLICCDKKWIGLARTGWRQDAEVEFVKFATEYKVVRTMPIDRRNDVMRAWRKRFSKCREATPAPTMSTLKDVWLAAVDDGNRICDVTLHSAASKFLWFFFPRHMTMYDKNARESLSRHVNTNIVPDNFLEQFEVYRRRSIEDIRVAVDLFSRKYAHSRFPARFANTRRIVDKKLWIDFDLKAPQEINEILGRVREWERQHRSTAI